MSFQEKSGGSPPPVPRNLKHNVADTLSYAKGEIGRRSTTEPSTTPYLGLGARLSQVWINRWTILLLIVLARVLISIGNINDNLALAKVKALSACTKVEDIGSAMASMPHYLSVGVNSLVADGIDHAVSGLVDVLMMILTGVEAIIMFVIQMYIGTYACLIAALIHGGLDVAVAAVEGAVKVFNDNIGKFADDINIAVSGVNKAITDLDTDIKNFEDSLKLPFGFSIDWPDWSISTIDISGDISDLKNIQINASSLVGDLEELNSTIPTFADVKNLTEQAISIPFNLVKNAVNSTYGDYSFDKSVFPVAAKESLAFCSDNSAINDFFNGLFDSIVMAKYVAIGLGVLLAVLVCIPMAWLEIKRWRREKKRAQLVKRNAFDPMDIIYIASRPFSSRMGIKISSWFSGRHAVLARWAVAYGTSLPALFVLSLAIAGLLTVACQAILEYIIRKEAPALASQVADFAAEVVTTLDNVSVKWANDANSVILKENQDINDDLFGWVTNATVAVNNTLNTFENDISTAITTVFQNTPLLNTVRDVVACLLTSKIDMMEKGLTWVHDHAHVTFPTFPNDTFSQGAAESIDGDSDLTSFLSSPSSVTTDEITGAVDDVIDALHSGMMEELYIALALLLVYIVVVLIGVMRMLVGMAMPDKSYDAGNSYVTAAAMDATDNKSMASYTGEGRAPLSPREVQRKEFGEHQGSPPRR